MMKGGRERRWWVGLGWVGWGWWWRERKGAVRGKGVCCSGYALEGTRRVLVSWPPGPARPVPSRPAAVRVRPSVAQRRPLTSCSLLLTPPPPPPSLTPNLLILFCPEFPSLNLKFRKSRLDPGWLMMGSTLDTEPKLNVLAPKGI